MVPTTLEYSWGLGGSMQVIDVPPPPKIKKKKEKVV